MGTISVSLPADGTGADVSDYNTPITTIVGEINGNLDNANIKSGAAIATSKLADDAGITNAKISGMSSSKLANPYKFLVYRSTNFTSSNGAFGKIQFDTKVFDTGSNYDNTTNYRFTAPLAGFYQFSTKSVAQGNTSGIIIYTALYKNGTEIPGTRGPTATSSTTVISAFTSPPVVSLALNDYVEVFLYASSTIGMAGDAGGVSTWFGGNILSTT